MVPLKTVLLVTISTSRLIFPGIPGARDLAETARQPAARSISFEVASDAAATKDSKAAVSLPDGLKQGKSVDLLVDLSTIPQGSDSATGSKSKTYQYWGVGRDVPAGQPKIAQPKPETDTTNGLPTKSYASWPNERSPEIGDTAATPGSYALKTDYCGSTTFTLDADQDFLAPLNLVQAAKEPDLDKPIMIKWRPVPNAAGYLIRAVGGDETKTVTWTSAAKLDVAEGLEYRPVAKDELDKLVQDNVLLPSYAITATIPAGVFKGSASVMLVLTAFGRDTNQTKDGINTQVIVRSTASYPIHSTPIVVPPSKHPKANRHFPNEDE